MRHMVSWVVLLFAMMGPTATAATLVLDLQGAHKVLSAQAVIRSEKENARIPGILNRGKCVFKDLQPGIYDVVLETKFGTIEGVNLKTYDELGRLETVDEFGKLKSKEFKDVLRRATLIKIFENKRRIFAIEGHAKRARVLVERFMDEDTSLPSEEPQVFWRIEIWIYRYWYGGWLRDKRYELILRKKATVKEFAKIRWVAEPALGGILIEDAKQPVVVCYTVPDALEPTMGVINGQRAEPKLKPPQNGEDGETEAVEELE